LKRKLHIVIFLLLFYNLYLPAENLKVYPKKGDAIINLFKRYEFTYEKNIDYFLKLNSGKLTEQNGLLLHQEYELPIKIVKFNGKNIRSSLQINYDVAKYIENYNNLLFKKGIKPKSYKEDLNLWVPFLEFEKELEIVSKDNIELKENITKKNSQKNEILLKNFNQNNKLFGEKNRVNKILDNKLNDYFFYLIAGHGGLDPGAIGFRNGFELHEHQYAYDVTLRLAKKLMESGANVFIIVQDEDDEISDEKFLKKSGTEKLLNGDTISSIQTIRLKQRTDLVNEIYRTFNRKGTNHLLIEIHVDSRITDKRIDIFFYHLADSEQGKFFCNTLLQTIREKYDKNQPGRGYRGTVQARNLFTLKNAIPTGVYIELGNIQNPLDQIRLIEPLNRQAIANWLYQGILRAYNIK